MENLSNVARGELLSRLVVEHARARPTAAFLRQSNPRRVFTFADLVKMASELCALFESANVKPGGSIAVVGNPDWLFHPLLVACAAAFVLAFVRPSGFSGLSATAYPLVVAGVVVVLGGPPLLFYALRRDSWDRRTAAERATADDVLVNPPESPSTSGAHATRGPAEPT